MTISHILKWTILVWLNAAFSFVMALNSSTKLIDIAGIVCAVFTFVAIYSVLDYLLIEEGNSELRVRLLWSVCLKILTQFFPAIEILTGSLSLTVIQELLTINVPFLSSYLTTMLDGFLLSLVVLIFIPIVGWVRKIFKAQSYTEIS